MTGVQRMGRKTDVMAWARRGWPLLLVVGLVGLGFALRLYRLGDLPYGMHPDEGFNALDALDILGGARPVFLPRNNGREPLFMYLMAAMLGWFGSSIWAVRLTGAVSGALVVLTQYLLVQSLPLPRPRVTALVSTALIATNFWAVHQGHKALRAGLLPAWLALMLWAWWLAIRQDALATGEGGPAGPSVRLYPPSTTHYLWSVVAGVALAAALYTYLSARVMPLILVLSALWTAWRARRWRPLVCLGITLAVAGVLAIPLGLYFVAHPEMFGFRADQISLLNPEVNQGNLVGMLVENGLNLLLAFNWRGSTWWYENLEGRPVFDVVTGIAFLAGMVYLARDGVGRRGQRAQGAAVLLAVALGMMLVPPWLTIRAPTYIRMTGLWPVLFLLPAWAIERLAAVVGRRNVAVGATLIVLLVGISATLSLQDLFVRYASAPEVYRGPRVSTAVNGQTIAQLVQQGPVYVSPAVQVQSVIRFLNHERPPGSFDPRAGLVLPPEGDPVYVFDGVELDDATAVGKRWPQLQREDRYDAEGEVSLILYRLRRADWPAPRGGAADAASPAFGDRIRLLAHEVNRSTVAPGQKIAVTLEWLVLGPTDIDHNFFVHLTGSGGRGVGQYDGPPLGGSYPTHRWQPGEHILQRVEITVAKDAPDGEAILSVGWYDWRSGERLPLPGDDDAALDMDRVTISPK